MIRILIVGDIRLYCEGVMLYLARQPHVELLGCACDRDAAAARVRELHPDVVLVDRAMPESLAAVRDMARDSPDARVVALTVPEIERAILACAEAGIAGYVSRDGSLADLMAVVESAARGELIVSPKMAASLLRRVGALAADRDSGSAHAPLTLREGEIVALIDEGLSNKQIAARLGVELATVKNHVHNILEKLHVHRRSQVGGQLRYERRRSQARYEMSRRGDELA